MSSDTLIKEWIASTDLEKITNGLSELTTRPSLSYIIELYESIWKMTYANATEVDIREVDAGPLAHKILLMNEQEDLVPAKLAPLAEVTALDLGGFPKAAFFPELFKYQGLKNLYFWDNSLETLPEAFYEFTQLEDLYICDGLASLSPGIGKLTLLRKLNLRGNVLKVLPAEVANLTQLEILDLSDNLLDNFELDLTLLHHLKKIDLSGNSESLIIDEQVLAITNARNIELLH
ncbi:MAG TPA: hypothetical protein DCS93_29235 [Microscillaceae bacterium]|nr:hypothetical protein [Microscillaceae bacterium]